MKNTKEKLIEIFNKFNSEPVSFQSHVYIGEYLKLIKSEDSIKELLCYFNSKNLMNVNVIKILSNFRTHNIEKGKYIDYSWVYYQYLDVYAVGLKDGRKFVKELKNTKSESKIKEKLKPIISEIKNIAGDLNKAKEKYPHFFGDNAYKKVFKTFHVYIINYLVTIGENEKGQYRNLEYIPKKGVFYFQNNPVKIRLQDRNTNEDRIMKYIFIKNKHRLKNDFFYREMADDFGDDVEIEREKNWSKYRTAFKALNNKICDDFFQYNASKKGRAKINLKYL